MSFIKKLFGIGDNDDEPNVEVNFNSTSNNKEEEKLYKYAFYLNPIDFEHMGMEKVLNEVIADYYNMLLELDPIIGNSWDFLNDILSLKGENKISLNDLPKNSNGEILGNYNLYEKIFINFGQKSEWFFEHDEEGHLIEDDDGNYIIKKDFELVCVQFKSPKQLRYEGIDKISTDADDSESFPLISSNIAVNLFAKNGMFKDWTFKLFEEGDDKKIDIILYNYEIKRYYQVELSYAKIGKISYYDDFYEDTSMNNYYS